MKGTWDSPHPLWCACATLACASGGCSGLVLVETAGAEGSRERSHNSAHRAPRCSLGRSRVGFVKADGIVRAVSEGVNGPC